MSAKSIGVIIKNKMNNLYDTDMADIKAFEESIRQMLFYSIDNRYLFGLNFKLKKERVLELLQHQKQLHQLTYPKSQTSVYDNWDSYPDLKAKNKAIQLQQISCNDVEETITGIYYKQSYQYIDSYVHCEIDDKTNELNTIEISFETNDYNEYWQKNIILEVVIDYLCYEYGCFENEFIEKDFSFKWKTENEIVSLLIRHPDNIEKFYYTYKVSVVENWD